MSDAREGINFLLCSVAVAVVILAFWGGIALLMANGAAQTCARHDGNWSATDTVVSHVGVYGVDRVRECEMP